MAFDFFNPIQAAVLAPVTAAFDVSGTLVAWMSPFIIAGVTIILMNDGMSAIRGNWSGNPLLESLAKCVKPFLVMALALAGGAYTNTVVGFFTELRNELTGLFGAKAGNSYAALDGATGEVLATSKALLPEALGHINVLTGDFSGIVMLSALATIVLAFLFYAIVAAVNLLLIDASLAIVFGLGPIFVACLAFQSTAKFFDSWLSAVLKYVLTAVLLGAIIGVATGMIQKLSTGFAANPDLAEVVNLAVGFFCGSALLVALITKVGAIAAELFGGVGLSIAGPQSVANALKTVAAPAANAAGYVAGAAIGAGTRAATAAGGMVAGSSLGAQVLKATESMRASTGASAAAAAGGIKNFAGAVGGSGGVGNAFNVGRNAAGSSSGTGTVTSGYPPRRIPHIKD